MKNTRNNELAVCGFAAVKLLEKNNWSRITRLYFTEERAPFFGGLCKKLAENKRPYNKVKDPLELEKLSGTVHHQGVVAMIKSPEVIPLNSEITAEWVSKKENVLLLDHVGNSNNFGAIVRSAAFFGIKNIVIPLDEGQSEITTSSYRIAEGGMEFVNIYSVKSIMAFLNDMKGRMYCIGTSLEAKESVSELKKYAEKKPCIVILGNEEKGMSKEVQNACDKLVIIPYKGKNADNQGPKMDSLNVAQAATVILYELTK